MQFDNRTLVISSVMVTGIGMRYTGWLLAVCGLTQFSRGVDALVHHASALFEPSNINALAFLCFAVAMTGGSFGFLGMMGSG